MVNQITRPLLVLASASNQVAAGNFDVELPPVVSDDELGVVTRAFSKMVVSIQEYIEKVRSSMKAEKEAQERELLMETHLKEAQLRYYQAQINPHFLYNSLSLINWKAIEYGQDDISGITLALSNYYRTSLNKGKNTLTVKQELSNMESYLNIQQIMHDNSFDVVMDIDENVLEYESLNLILQPLVENAIEHGIDLLTDRRGVITVAAKLYNGLIHIEVKDNGIGMPKETAHTFLTSESGGYGARNVNDRIRLFYGEQYNLKVSSDENGTVITIEFPARKPV